MTSTLQSFHVRQPIAVWLRRLLPIAQTNRQFDSEDQTLTTPTNQAWPTDTARALESVSNAQTPAVFGQNFAATEHVLRMAVMVAIADDAHALCDDEILFHYYQSLGLTTDVLDTICTLSEMPSVEPAPQQMMVRGVERSIPSDASPQAQRSVLQSLRDWLDSRGVPNPKVAHVLCKLIPSQCPFERDIHLFGRTIAHIPPLCKLNPLYDQLVGLRFRALSYLADECGEDISSYC